MPKFTALIHADGIEGLESTLGSCRIANETLVIYGGQLSVERLCWRYWARCTRQIPGVTSGAYAMDAFHDWLLLLLPGEILSSETANALSTWRQRRQDNTAGYLIRCGEGRPQLRFVNRSQLNWIGDLPPVPTHAGIFPGRILQPEILRAA